MRTQHTLGKKGEDLAVHWLKSIGFEIRERNYRFGKAEIDILAARGEILSVVEVKMRRAGQLQPLEVVIGRKKRERLITAADHYVLTHNLDVEVRFDIIHVVHHENTYTLEHLEGAFSPY